MIKPRTAELVLVTPKGDPAGYLPAVPVATPWWPDVGPVVQAVHEHHGVDVIVLRLLDAEPTDAERDAVDAFLGPSLRVWAANGGHAAHGGHAARAFASARCRSDPS